jgi:hypothetical protein
MSILSSNRSASAKGRADAGVAPHSDWNSKPLSLCYL